MLIRTVVKDAHCYKCAKRTHFVLREVEHARWFLVVCVIQIAIVLWIYLALAKAYRCSMCGQKEKKFNPPSSEK